MYDFTTLQKFYKKTIVKKFIILTSILSYIMKYTAILFCKNVWITFLILFSGKIKFSTKFLDLKNKNDFVLKIFDIL